MLGVVIGQNTKITAEFSLILHGKPSDIPIVQPNRTIAKSLTVT
jgi:hypothetical protein